MSRSETRRSGMDLRRFSGQVADVALDTVTTTYDETWRLGHAAKTQRHRSIRRSAVVDDRANLETAFAELTDESVLRREIIRSS